MCSDKEGIGTESSSQMSPDFLPQDLTVVYVYSDHAALVTHL